MKYIRFILAILIMLFVVVLIVENHEAMSTQVSFRLDLLGWSYKTGLFSLYQIVTVSFLFGVLITAIYGIIERWKLRKEIRSLQREIRDKDQELNSLRNLPITSEKLESVSNRSEEEYSES